jgi:hypothetical protein
LLQAGRGQQALAVLDGATVACGVVGAASPHLIQRPLLDSNQRPAA